MHVHEGHHDLVRARKVRVLTVEGQRRLVAVMAVGDEQLLRAHQLLEARDPRRVGYLPQPVLGLVLVGDARQRLGARGVLQDAIDLAFGIRIEHEELAEMGVAVAQQREPVLLRTRERLLVAVDDALRIILHRAQPDEAFAHQPLAGIGIGELLKVREQRRLGLAREHAALDPVL